MCQFINLIHDMHGMQYLHWTTKFLSAACVSDKVVQAITLAKKG